MGEPVNSLLPTVKDLNILGSWYQEHEIVSRQKPHLGYMQLYMSSSAIART